MKIGIVILNYLNWKDTVECIDSLLLQSDQNFEIVVVDNCSKNETIEILEGKYKNLRNFHLLEMQDNIGFAQGNNAGIRFCMHTLQINNILVINNDVVFQDKDYISKLKQFPLDNNVGAYGTKIIGLDGINQNPLKFNPSFYEVTREYLFPLVSKIKESYVYKKIKRNGNQNLLSETKANPNSGSYILHGSVIYFTENYLKEFEGFYPETFLYYEENILGILFKKCGLEMKYIDSLEILHKEDQSSTLSFNNESGVKYKFGRESVRIAFKVLFLSKKKIRSIINTYPYTFRIIHTQPDKK